jgi:hypothetical protein
MARRHRITRVLAIQGPLTSFMFMTGFNRALPPQFATSPRVLVLIPIELIPALPPPTPLAMGFHLSIAGRYKAVKWR